MKKLLIFILAVSSCAPLPFRATQRTHSHNTSKKTIKRNSSTKVWTIKEAILARKKIRLVAKVASSIKK